MNNLMTLTPLAAWARIRGIFNSFNLVRPRTAPYISYIAILLSFSIAGCDKPKYPTTSISFAAHNSISPDGKYISIVLRNDNGASELRLISTDAANQKDLYISLPERTSSVNFSLDPNEVLITHAIGPGSEAALSRLNLSVSPYESRTLHSGIGLSHPIEISPNIYLVRTCQIDIKNDLACAVPRSHSWLVLSNGSINRRLEAPIGAGYYAQPNVITDHGVFWLNLEYSLNPKNIISYKNEIKPRLLIASLKSNTTINLPHIEDLDEATQILQCDYLGNRCIRAYITNPSEPVTNPYRYKAEAFEIGKSCEIPDAYGYIKKVSITPDGNFSAITISSSHEEPGVVKVFHFIDDDCAPALVKTINLG